MGLKIDEFLTTEKVAETKVAEVEKTAADHALEVIDQSGVLVSIGESLHKFASEQEELAPLAAIGEDLFNIGSRMGAALSKTAASEPHALVDSLEIAEDLYKVASAFAEIADAMEDEDLSKDASAVIDISNVLTGEANEFYEAMQAEETAKTAEVEKEAGKVGDMLSKMKAHLKAKGEAVTEAAKKAKETASEHVKTHKGKYIAAASATGGAVAGYAAGKHSKK